MLDRWQSLGATTEATLHVASSEHREVVVVDSPDFVLSIYPCDVPDMPWILSLRVNERLLCDWPAGLRLELSDTGAKIWLVGRPNERGEINAGWYDQVVTPHDRLLDHRLRLTPI